MLTNRLGLPEPIARAVANDGYDHQGSDGTVTELIGPARLAALKRRHAADLVEDVADRLWSLWGRNMHAILETAGRDLPDHLTETRLFAQVRGWKVSGALDTMALLEGTLSDYKAVGWYSIKDGPKPEWVSQLNLLTLLLREHGHTVQRAEIVALIRDHRHSEYQRKAKEGYPAVPVQRLPVPLWTPMEQYTHLIERVQAHQAARQALAVGEPLPHCTPDERWQQPTLYAVSKLDSSRALRVFGSKLDARAFVQAAAKPDQLRIDTRVGKAVRCSRYCPVLAQCQALDDGQIQPGELETTPTDEEA